MYDMSGKSPHYNEVGVQSFHFFSVFFLNTKSGVFATGFC
jgi:hypothetical protein